MEHRRHFQPNDAAANDKESLRDFRQLQRIGRIHHARIVPWETRQLHRLRTSSDDALPEAQQLLAVRSLDLQFVRRHEASAAGDDAHLALFRHRRQTFRQLSDNFGLVIAQLVERDLRCAEVDAVIGCARSLIDHRGRMQ